MMIRKSNSKFEMMFVLGFLLTLIISFGTFYFGLNIGIEKTEARYAYLKEIPPGQETALSYQQQDLVTFYYVVFQPYQQFKEDYLALVDEMARSNSNAVASDAIKQISENASTQYALIAGQYISDSSPLLKQAQTDYLKSLKLFEEGTSQVKSAVKGKKGNELIEALAADEFTSNAQSFGLQAQQKYYSSILKWTAKTNQEIPDNLAYKDTLTIKEWSQYPLAVKNKIVTDMMTNEKIYASYLPQDLTVKIDQMIDSSKADALQLKSVASIVKVLTETQAVKEQEFVKWRTAYYASESLPQLPFFTEE